MQGLCPYLVLDLAVFAAVFTNSCKHRIEIGFSYESPLTHNNAFHNIFSQAFNKVEEAFSLKSFLNDNAHIPDASGSCYHGYFWEMFLLWFSKG